jgi:hypothetical protein
MISDRPVDLPMKKRERALTISRAQRVPGAERRVASGIQDVGGGSTPATRFRCAAAIESRFWAGFRIISGDGPGSPRDTAAAYDSGAR